MIFLSPFFLFFFFFLMIRRPPRSTPLYSSAASDVYKRQPLLRVRVRAVALADARLRAAGARVWRLPGHGGDELRRRGRPVHPDPRVPTLPPRAAVPHGPDRRRAGILTFRRTRGRAVLPDQHPGRPAAP